MQQTCLAWLATTIGSSHRISGSPPVSGRFVPSHIAASDATLLRPDGKPGSPLSRGTLVSAVRQGDRLAIRTEAGSAGLVDSRLFSRLRDTIPVTDALRELVRSGNEFSFDLWQQLRRDAGDVFFSPISVSTALAMTYAGAQAATRQEMASVLHLNPEQPLSGEYAGLIDLLNSTDRSGGTSITMANRLWVDDGLTLNNSFLDTNRQVFQAEPQLVKFSRSEEARQTINDWVELQTRDLIQDLIPPGVLTADSLLVLTNAIHFKGRWKTPFSVRATRPLPFYPGGDRDVLTPTMVTSTEFLYAETETLQAVALPYQGDDLVMVVVVPRERDGLSRVEAELAAPEFLALRNAMTPAEVHLFLPKFRLRSQFRLLSPLVALGMASAFSGRADFSGMSSQERLMISDVVHQAFVETNEEGTEAAAATAVVVDRAPAPVSTPPVVRADHPFLVFIQDQRSRAILFMGRIAQPEAA